MKTVKTKKMEKSNLQWRVHTANLLKEILNNPGTGILSKPLNIFGRLLAEVGEEAARINDPKLNALMLRLSIYSMSCPESPDYDPKETDRIIKEANNLKK